MTEQMQKPETEKPEPPATRLVPNPAREKMVPLDWPVEHDGQIITEIRVRRVTGKEVQDFITKMGSSPEYVIPPVIDCPIDVWNQIDADDTVKIEKEAENFLPLRLKEVFAWLLQNGENTADSSATSSAGPSPTS